MLVSVKEQVYQERGKPEAPKGKEYAVGVGQGKQDDLFGRRGGKKEHP